MTITKLDALNSLVPTAEWVLFRGETIIWKDSKVTQPTDSAINAEIARLQAEYDTNAYQRTRRPLYPSLEDFADAMYWNSKGDASKLTAYYADCEKVKTDNPKS